VSLAPVGAEVVYAVPLHPLVLFVVVSLPSSDFKHGCVVSALRADRSPRSTHVGATPDYGDRGSGRGRRFASRAGDVRRRAHRDRLRHGSDVRAPQRAASKPRQRPLMDSAAIDRLAVSRRATATQLRFGRDGPVGETWPTRPRFVA
jgi:hypothetical protein